MARKRNQPIKTKAFLILAGVLGMLFAALPIAILMSVGMMPTLVALIVDMTRGRHLTKCVAGMNLAGVLPFLYRLVTTGHDVQTAMTIVSDAFAWLVMYSAAAIGWLLFMGLPGVVSMFKVLTAKRRIYILQEQQRTLLNEWGESILPNRSAREGNEEQTEGSMPPPPPSADGVKPNQQPNPAIS